MNDDNLKFKPNYPYTLPEDWHNRNDPSIYEIMATLATLKKMYEKQVLEVENGHIKKTLGEKKCVILPQIIKQLSLCFFNQNK